MIRKRSQNASFPHKCAQRRGCVRLSKEIAMYQEDWKKGLPRNKHPVASEQWDSQIPELNKNIFLLFYPENKKTLSDTQSSAVPEVNLRNAG